MIPRHTHIVEADVGPCIATDDVLAIAQRHAPAAQDQPVDRGDLRWRRALSGRAEGVADTVRRSNDRCGRWSIVERAPQFLDQHRQCTVGHEGRRPQLLLQLTLGDHAGGFCGEQHEQVECLRREVYGGTLVEQLPPVTVDRECPEVNHHRTRREASQGYLSEISLFSPVSFTTAATGAADDALEAVQPARYSRWRKTMFLLRRKSDHETACARQRLAPSPVAFVQVAAVLAVLTVAPVASAQNVRQWSPAVSVDPARQLGVNTNVNDGCPYEAPDGHILFMATNRVPGAPGTKDLDIWVAYRNSVDSPWGTAEPLPAPVNTAAAEFCPTPLAGNGLLFVSTRVNGCGDGNDPDIYFSRLRMSPLGWSEPTPLSCDDVTGINSRFEEFSPSLVQADGRTLLFFSSNRDTGVAGLHKIYSSELRADGTWTPAEQVGKLNSAGFSDARPNLSDSGLEIVFDSNRAGTFDIYLATRGSLDAEWSSPKRLDDAVNSDTADETRGSFSRDGQRLYFGSTRANGVLGGSGGDIYVSTRLRVWRGFAR